MAQLADPRISPSNSVAYAWAVVDTMGQAAAAGFMRLFVVPGMAHCAGGDSLTSVDALAPLRAWVEDGRAPDALVASRSDADARTGRGRSSSPWPARAHLRLGIDPDSPASWDRVDVPAPQPNLYADWLGAASSPG